MPLSEIVRGTLAGPLSYQPGPAVTASSGGHPKSWHTDGSGYAAVYLHGPCAGR